MHAKLLIPILNVSDIQQSFTWFEKLGWKKAWDWGSPPDFGCVSSGEYEIFLSENCLGGRGKGPLPVTYGSMESVQGDKGVWLCIMVDDVEVVHQHCLEQGLEITWPPTDAPWGIREMHVRHPDGHVFRIGHEIEEAEKCADSDQSVGS